MKKSIFLFFAAILCSVSAWAATPTKIYLNAKDWGYGDARFAAYFFDPAKWVDMKKVDGETYIYEVDVPSGYTKVILCRMNGSKPANNWDNKWNQSGDLTIPTNGKNMFKPDDWDGKTTTWSTYTPKVSHTFTKNSTLYIDFRNITDASKRGANYPKAGSVGIDYSANAGGTVIPVTFTADVKWAEGTEFIKTDQGGWASIPFKAPSAGQNCAQVAADGKSYTWTTYSEPSVTLSLDKESADAGTEVTVTLTATADNVAGEVTYAFQYSTDNATWNNISSTGNTATQTFAAETRYYKVTMTNGGNTKEATAKFSAIVFHVIGSWDDWTTHNEVVEGSKTIALEANKTYEYKITDGTWDNHWGNDGTMNRENCTGWSFESGNNAKIKTDEAGDYVFNVSRNAEGKVKVSVTYPELVTPIPTYDYYLTGSLVGGWDVKQQGIEKDGELYKAAFTELNAGIYEFKITAGDWEHQWNYNNLGAAYEEVSQGVDGEGNPNGNIKIVTEEAKNITVIFDGSKITFEGLTPYVAPLTYTVTVPAGTEKCYIAGAFAQSNWNTFVEMTKVGDEDKFTIEIAGAKETDEYKYACQADWVYAEVIDGGGNRTQWTALDNVTAWGKPAVPTLMGIGGDWTTGIEMTINPDNADEYMLLGQVIASAETVKIKYGDTWCATLEETSAGTIVKDAMDQDNISLAAGTYDFYYKKNDNKVWIGVCTPATPTLVTPTVVANSYFSVGEGEFVQFSTGNLQYNVGTNTWSFASEQYEVIGGEVYTGSNNTNYGMNEPGYTGKLDLFAWSCDGKFGVNPSNADADYTGEFADWGKLVNEEGWYTLTKDEMNYLLNRKKDGKKLWALATVCGMNGLILLPDNWNTSTTLEYGYVPADWNYTKNQLDDAAWADLEAAGAVFLPEGGTRVGGHGNKEQGGGPAEFDAHGDYFHVDNVGEMGYYWFNTQDARAGYENCASYLILPGWNNNGTPADESDDKALAPQVWSREKRRGNSVRLVKEVTPDSYYTRTVTSGDYGTICLPNGGLLLGASAFSVAKMEGTTILLDEVGTIMVGGTPYVVFPNTGAKKLYVFYTDNANAPAGNANGLYGSYTRDELAPNAGNYIMLPGNKYAEVTGSGVFVAAKRAYFKVGEISPIAPAPAPGVRRIAIGQAPQVATGMENIDASAQPVKMIIDGQLYILRGEKMYDAQGKLVK